MAVYTFDLTASDVADMRLATQTPDTSSGSALDLALTEAAAAVVREVELASGGSATDITSSTYEADYEYLRSLVSWGALYYYSPNATGVAQDDIRREWLGGMSDLRERPQILAYVLAQDATSFVTTHTSSLTQAQIDRYRADIPTPEKRGWGIS